MQSKCALMKSKFRRLRLLPVGDENAVTNNHMISTRYGINFIAFQTPLHLDFIMDNSMLHLVSGKVREVMPYCLKELHASLRVVVTLL